MGPRDFTGRLDRDILNVLGKWYLENLRMLHVRAEGDLVGGGEGMCTCTLDTGQIMMFKTVKFTGIPIGTSMEMHFSLIYQCIDSTEQLSGL